MARQDHDRDSDDDYGPDIELDSELEAALNAAEGLANGGTPGPSTALVPHDTGLVDIEDIAGAAKSPFEEWRRWGSLSVSDLVGTVWCEVQFDYRLRTLPFKPVAEREKVIKTAQGAEIKVDQGKVEGKERILRRGEKIHKRLEREIHPEQVLVLARGEEEKWALRVYTMLTAFQALLELGKCRELPVSGFVGDVLVMGIIDEIVREPIDDTAGSGVRTRAQRQSTLEGFGFSTGPRPRTHRLLVSDSKTRASGTLPREADTKSGRLQVMLYKELLDALLIAGRGGTHGAGDAATSVSNGSPPAPSSMASTEPVQPTVSPAADAADASSPFALLPTANPVGLAGLFTYSGVDLQKEFAPAFVTSIHPVIFGNNLQWGAREARCLADLIPVWFSYVDALGLGTHGPGARQKDGVTDDTLELVYRRAAPKGDKAKRRQRKRRRGRSSRTKAGGEAIMEVDDAANGGSVQATQVTQETGVALALESLGMDEDAALQLAIQMSIEESLRAGPSSVAAASAQLPEEKGASFDSAEGNGRTESSQRLGGLQSLEADDKAFAPPGSQDQILETARQRVETTETQDMAPETLDMTSETQEPMSVPQLDIPETQDETPETQDMPETLIDDDETQNVSQADAQNSSGTLPGSTPPISRTRPGSRLSDDGCSTEQEREYDELASSVERNVGAVASLAAVPVGLSQGSPPGAAHAHNEAAPAAAPTTEPPTNPITTTNTDAADPTSGAIIGRMRFSHDRTLLANHLVTVLQYWRGNRPPRGVAPHEVGRCAWCEFEDGCEWRAEKAREALEKYRQSRA